MKERKSLLEQALDVFLYAPVGLGIAVTEELPQLIDKGRTRVNSQLTMAKMVGSFAVAQGQREAERVVKQATGLVSQGGGAPGSPGTRDPGDFGIEASDSAPGAPQPTGDTSPGRARRAASRSPWLDETADRDGTGARPGLAGSDAGAGSATQARPWPTEGVGTRAQAAEPPLANAGTLAIPGYDALSASHVVQRLAGLAADELEAVRAYEAATRGRKTILSRIAQIQASGRS